MRLLPSFDKDIAINSVLYILKEMGGTSGIHKIFKILYFADREHLAKYGRRVSRDVYFAMNFGPVPSKIYDMLKAVRGDSYFSDSVDDARSKIAFINKKTVKALAEPDMDYLSDSDIECLDNSIKECKDASFKELTDMSHGYAWSETLRDSVMSYADIMRENGETEEYAQYIHNKIKAEDLVF